MRGAILYGPRDVRFAERETPRIIKPTDAIIRMSATCVCGSDLWSYRGINKVAELTPMGHEYCGIVEEIGSAVRSIRPGQRDLGRRESQGAAQTTGAYTAFLDMFLVSALAVAGAAVIALRLMARI